MHKYELSIIIPARQEEWLPKTIKSVLDNTSDATEVIALLDEAWPHEAIPDYPRLTLVHTPRPIGQRAAINRGARISRAKYICKLDAHCTVGPEFDVTMMKDARYDVTYIPRMYNFHVFDWNCLGCGNRTYQGPEPRSCTVCKGIQFERVVVWEPRWSRVTDSMGFDSEVKFNYFRDFSRRREGKGDLTPSLGLLGACFFLERKRYWELGGSDLRHGSWGQQGVEIALTAQISGGSVMCNKKAYFSHLFRTQPGFGFPYPIKHSDQEAARVYSRWLWLGGNYFKAKRTLSSVVEPFMPVPGWTDDSLDKQKASEVGRKQIAVPDVPAPTKKATAVEVARKYAQSAPDTGLTVGVVYYTDNKLDRFLFETCQKQILRGLNGHQLVSVSLQPLDFGDNYVLSLERGYLAIAQQILMGLSNLDTDFAFFAEHDVLYAENYFSSFIPPRRDKVYYNENVWKLRSDTGETLFYYHKSLSQLCADRRLLIDHFRERIARMEAGDSPFRMGFEPGCKALSHGGVDDLRNEVWFAPLPNIDVRHHLNNTRNQWHRREFRDPKYTLGWRKRKRVPGWPGTTFGRFRDFLADINKGR